MTIESSPVGCADGRGKGGIRGLLSGSLVPVPDPAMDRNSPKPGAEAAGGTPVGKGLLGIKSVSSSVHKGVQKEQGFAGTPPPFPPSPGGVWKSPEHLQKKDRFLFSKVKGSCLCPAYFQR